MDGGRKIRKKEGRWEGNNDCDNKHGESILVIRVWVVEKHFSVNIVGGVLRMFENG